MSYTYVAPSTDSLNGYADGYAPNFKATKPVQSKEQSKVQPKTDTDTTNTKHYTYETAMEKPEYVNYNKTQGNDIDNIAIPFLGALVFMYLGFVLFQRLTRNITIKGFSHGHRRAGGPLHNTPGEMLPRAFPKSKH